MTEAVLPSPASPAPSEHQPDSGEEIVCRVTPWFFRRMGIMTALFIGMGSYFLYDGQWGYAKANLVRDEWERVVEAGKEYDALKATPEAWPAVAKEKNYPLNDKGEPQRWASYAAGRGWSAEEPKRYSEGEIREQFYWGFGTIAAGMIPLFFILRDRARTLRADAATFTTPGGLAIPFSEVFRIDKRKWAKEGLAFAWHRAQGAEKKTPIDDLKYAGADRVLSRIMENFSGELIDKVAPAVEPPSEEDEEAADSEAKPVP